MTDRSAGMAILADFTEDRAVDDQLVIPLWAEEEVTINTAHEASAYEAVLNGIIVAGVTFSETAEIVTLLKTAVFPAFHGVGLGARTVAAVLQKLRIEGRRVALCCPFAMAFVVAHPGYDDILTPPVTISAL